MRKASIIVGVILLLLLGISVLWGQRALRSTSHIYMPASLPAGFVVSSSPSRVHGDAEIGYLITSTDNRTILVSQKLRHASSEVFPDLDEARDSGWLIEQLAIEPSELYVARSPKNTTLMVYIYLQEVDIALATFDNVDVDTLLAIITSMK